MNQEIEPTWVDYPTATHYSGLSHTTLWRSVRAGEIRAAKIGRSTRIYFPSLKEFMESRASGGADE